MLVVSVGCVTVMAARREVRSKPLCRIVDGGHGMLPPGIFGSCRSQPPSHIPTSASMRVRLGVGIRGLGSGDSGRSTACGKQEDGLATRPHTVSITPPRAHEPALPLRGRRRYAIAHCSASPGGGDCSRPLGVEGRKRKEKGIVVFV